MCMTHMTARKPPAEPLRSRRDVPVKRLLQGTPPDKAVNPDSVDDLGALRFYERPATARFHPRPVRETSRDRIAD